MGCFSSRGINIDEDDIKKDSNKKSNVSLVPEKISDKLIKTIIRIKSEKKISTSFFMKINLDKKQHIFLLTSAHCIYFQIWIIKQDMNNILIK